MERLTEREGLCVKSTRIGDFGTQNILHKLAYYEDLEEQGLLLKLPAPLDGVEMFGLEGHGIWLRMPCYIGDTVYEIAGVKWVGDRDWQYRTYKEAYAKETKFTLEKYNLFGLTVFFTKEEAEKKIAEKALAEMKGE